MVQQSVNPVVTSCGEDQFLLPDTHIPRHRDLGSCLDVDTRSADPISIGILASLPQRCALLTDEGLTLDPMTGLYYARNRSYDLTLANVLRQEPKFRYSRSKESGLMQEPKSRLSPGVAHREINQDPLSYPGAVALTRLGSGTRFRLGNGSSDRLNINGANTYQFVESNPVGNVDPNGLSGAGAALGQYLYWQSATDQLVNQFQHYQGQQLGLLKGIAAASELEALNAENQFYNIKHESPLQSLGDLREHLEKAAKIGKHVPYAKPLADVLERLAVLISVVKAERGLASNTGPGQMKGLGNALIAAGPLMPPELGPLVPLVKADGQFLVNAGNAVNYIDQLAGNKAYYNWVHGFGNVGSTNGDIPFTPDWANTILIANGQSLPAFTQAYTALPPGPGD
ncbi:MAG: RHS repeat-associated core domain-containing protein [Phycisphaerae bacterium]